LFYVQYGHAGALDLPQRARGARGPPGGTEARVRYLADTPLELLDDSVELALMKKIAEYPAPDRSRGGGDMSAPDCLLSL